MMNSSVASIICLIFLTTQIKPVTFSSVDQYLVSASVSSQLRNRIDFMLLDSDIVFIKTLLEVFLFLNSDMTEM